ncbi:MAG TPA: DUF4270 family protein [Mucilaginibacter sp.]|jgi:hypothetical protein
MKFFRLDLLTLLISLFILNSCKNQDTVGLGITAPGQITGNLVDTSTIIVNTVPEDSVITSGNLPKNPLGYFTDPIFGVTTSNIATDLNLPGSAAYTLPTGTITVDSARLVLRYANGFYGDSITSKYTVNVYQLQNKFDASKTYYNTTSLGATSSLIGSLTFNARTHDSIKIYHIIAGAPDTLIKVPPQIRIPIIPSFINNNIFYASSTTLSSNAIFQNAVKGLYITLDKTKTTGPGGIFMIAPSDSLSIYYRVNNGSSIDTAEISLPISSFAAQISHTYTSTIQAELADTTTSRNTFYLQGLAGLRARVKFPNLLANLRAGLLKKDSDLVINRGELVITPTPGSDIPYSPIPKITMYRLDIAHQRAPIEDANSGDARSGGVGIFGGFYNPNLNEYHFILTAYLQDQLLGKTIDYGTYIAPIDINSQDAATHVDIDPTVQVASRTVAVGSDKSSPYRIKLNIIYTKVARK